MKVASLCLEERRPGFHLVEFVGAPGAPDQVASIRRPRPSKIALCLASPGATVATTVPQPRCSPLPTSARPHIGYLDGLSAWTGFTHPVGSSAARVLFKNRAREGSCSWSRGQSNEKTMYSGGDRLTNVVVW